MLEYGYKQFKKTYFRGVFQILELFLETIMVLKPYLILFHNLFPELVVPIIIN